MIWRGWLAGCAVASMLMRSPAEASYSQRRAAITSVAEHQSWPRRRGIPRTRRCRCCPRRQRDVLARWHRTRVTMFRGHVGRHPPKRTALRRLPLSAAFQSQQLKSHEMVPCNNYLGVIRVFRYWRLMFGPYGKPLVHLTLHHSVRPATGASSESRQWFLAVTRWRRTLSCAIKAGLFGCIPFTHRVTR